MGFPGGSDGEESACNVGDLSSIPGLGGSAGEGIGYPFQYSGRETSTDYTVSPWGHKESDTTELLSLHSLKEQKQKTSNQHQMSCIMSIGMLRAKQHKPYSRHRKKMKQTF